jgi:hypothetical protein
MVKARLTSRSLTKQIGHPRPWRVSLAIRGKISMEGCGFAESASSGVEVEQTPAQNSTRELKGDSGSVYKS